MYTCINSICTRCMYMPLLTINTPYNTVCLVILFLTIPQHRHIHSKCYKYNINIQQIIIIQVSYNIDINVKLQTNQSTLAMTSVPYVLAQYMPSRIRLYSYNCSIGPMRRKGDKIFNQLYTDT